ncbi:cell envelope biogenesis protein OmpA [Pokkaliibacter plantistimulans]|uniref:Cell envelope biogenesis protein OmpA n=1 Tax=Proteobacteria bacterium 228 TaxID=2083153 RepID=A0A2S5KN79_9PROT|nr:OmpA family protein [Pokkaliibacter plantistimulans]PPC76248.1 cell envelope biogenesis protein OmpA [Pokkaliibacter plantistimulans]
MIFLRNKASEEDESHWLSVSDLMSGLMMVFLFIAVALMLKVSQDKGRIEEVAVSYQQNQVAIYDALMTEFSKDLERWDAEIDKDSLTFVFKSPDVLFGEGKADLASRYKQLLDDFFPRYLNVLWQFRDSISEVRIEGHTSSRWNQVTDTTAYFNNMQLSQDRTRAVLNYVYLLPSVESRRDWIKQHIAAVGLSSSHVMLDEQGQENPIASRRVTLRVITNADVQMRKILEMQ